jgi:hypothetical protein
MNINFQKLAKELSDNNLMQKSFFSMTKEEITTLCRIVWDTSIPLGGAEDIPFD